MTKFSYWKQKRHLKRNIHAEEKPYARLLSEASRQDNRQKLDELLAERDAMIRYLIEERDELDTKYLTSKAEDYWIPLNTNDKEMWTNNILGRLILTDKGKYELRSKIMAEQRRRRETIMFWFSLAFGLISAITAMIAVISNK